MDIDKNGVIQQMDNRIKELEKKVAELERKPTTLHECYIFQWQFEGETVIGAQDRKDSGWLSACLNYRGREDERDRIWWNDAMPDARDIKDYQLATFDNVRRFISELIADSCCEITMLSVNVEARMVIFETKNDDNVIDDDLNF